jgi:hypothetical protein
MEKGGTNLADRPRSISVQETSDGMRIILGSRLRSIPDTRFWVQLKGRDWDSAFGSVALCGWE